MLPVARVECQFEFSNTTGFLTSTVNCRQMLDFDELWDQGTKIDLPGTSLRIASIDHLILMKRKASRPQDLLDIEQPEKIKRLLGEQGIRPHEP
jgi:hypothetical protein